ncbi:MAG: hypothetical protein PHW33_01730 [Candidatus Portnoybacteria bacterium]|jgi:hypothetical protein|nr:hypothetical protein [Candidatus Portnoybacteria bacterium]
MKRKCIICEVRPVQKGHAAGYCKQCADQIAARSARAPKTEVEKYLYYRGKVAAVIYTHSENGVRKFKVVQVFKSVDTLPKGKVINLDTYCEGYTRDQIKKFKRVLAAAS